MTDMNERVKDWNETIIKIEQARDEARRRAIAKPHGWRRKGELFFARVFARLAEAGKRWRNEDMTND